MLFNSFDFFIFFPIVTILYFLLPHKIRWFHLLISSCIFYMAYIPIYILILIITIIIDYFAGILIEKAEGKNRKLFLLMSLFANIGILMFFKYYNFFIENVNFLLHVVKLNNNLPLLKILLPIGLSFHTFQAMSYTIEVYRGNQRAEKHFGIYALYVMFYPQLVAGPIERPQNILPQLHEKHYFNYDDAVAGLRLILWGLVKKVVVADRLAIMTDQIFSNPKDNSGVYILIGSIFFAFQIFCDFSGYSDIALGTARFMGIKLMVNFNWPYSAKSISEFWRRWHISLSSWFNDYLYTPIAISNRKLGIYAVVVASVCTFLISGLWHGAAWTYIIWGALHGLALSYEVLTKKLRKKVFKKIPKKLGDFISLIATFSYVCFTYVFFRAKSVSDAFVMARKLAGIPSEILKVIKTHKLAFLNLHSMVTLYQCFSLIICFEFVHLIIIKYKLGETFGRRPLLFRWLIYFSGLACFYMLGVFEKRTFIYFQF